MKAGATQEEIHKAYRKKSKVLHPDKAKQSFIASKATGDPRSGTGKPSPKKKPGVRVSKGPSESEVRKAVKAANERFARLGLVAKILRGPGRERYDHFLKNGFPKWRGTGYYYARYRPGLGAVLMGLFLFGGGAAHYAALYLSWKRQREFVDRYVRHARRAAWGDELGIKGIPPLDRSSSASDVATDPNEATAPSMNRRQRRTQERETKKGRGPKESPVVSSEGTTPSTGPTGERKRVVAENGKVLIVDSLGNVYLEEANKEGKSEEYLLDVSVVDDDDEGSDPVRLADNPLSQVNEIPRPTIKQTVVFRLPVWLVSQVMARVRGPFGSATRPQTAGGLEETSSESESDEVSVDAEVPSSPNGQARWRGQKANRAR